MMIHGLANTKINL